MKHRSRNYPKNNQRKYNNRPQREQQRENQHSNFSRNGSPGNGSENRNNRAVIQSILPSPEILQEYEYASEGTVAKLLEMAQTEQDRRNEWEAEYLRFHKKSLRFGQFFGFILLCSVIYGTMFLASINQPEVAKILAISGFFSVAAASLFSEIGRRLSRRPKR